MAAVTGASIYEEFDITSRDGKKTVSIIGGVIDFQYFEDLYSPVTTAVIQISNTGNTTGGQGLFNGLPIRGGERVNFKIKTPFDNLLGKSETFDYIMYVDKIGNYISSRQIESFTLHLISREGTTNSQTRVSRKYVGETIDKSLQQIIGLLEPLQSVNFEKTENIYPFIGNMKHPLTWAMTLASKAIPVGSKGNSAGFFFWQTKRGFQFKSIDGLVKTAKEKTNTQKYYYRQIMNESSPENATVILDFQANATANVLEDLSRGQHSAYRIYFNPLDFTFTQPNESLFKPLNENRLGESEQPALITDPENINATQWAPRIISGVYNVGTLEVGVSTNLNSNPYNDVAQASSRYSSFFSIDYTILVPVNTNLCAGDPVHLEFPKVTMETPDIDRKTSGLYIIKEITHKFLPTKSYTSMRVVKDSHGINTKS